MDLEGAASTSAPGHPGVAGQQRGPEQLGERDVARVVGGVVITQFPHAVTTITEMTAAPAPLLAEGHHQRWEHETGNAQLKTHLRGPGKVPRSRSPDMVRQEIYGYLLTHYALSALICRAATEAAIDPDRVKFKRTVRVVRRRAADPAAFPP